MGYFHFPSVTGWQPVWLSCFTAQWYLDSLWSQWIPWWAQCCCYRWAWRPQTAQSCDCNFFFFCCFKFKIKHSYCFQINSSSSSKNWNNLLTPSSRITDEGWLISERKTWEHDRFNHNRWNMYSQLSSSSEQVWESRGKRLKSMLQAAVTVTLSNTETTCLLY